MLTLIVEGWRFIPQSYALVSQQLCLELAGRAGIRLLHRDQPFYYDWWRQTSGLWPPEQEAVLQGLPEAAPGEPADAVIRVASPFRFHNDPNARRTLVFATTEFKFVRDSAVGGGSARDALSRAQATLMAPSKWAAEGLVESGAPPRQVIVVPHGVDTRSFKPAVERSALRRQLGWEDKLVILHLGAMTYNKGVGLLLRAFAALAARFPQALLVLKGADELYRSRELLPAAFAELSAAEAEAIAPRLSYLGATLPTHAMVELLQSADLYVSPYRAEGFNLPVLEAAACGLPVVCTAGGPTDDFTSEEFALRIDSRLAPGPDGGVMLAPDSAHLTALVERALSDRAWRERAAVVGPRWVAERYTWRHAADAMLAALFPGASSGPAR